MIHRNLLSFSLLVSLVVLGAACTAKPPAVPIANSTITATSQPVQISTATFTPMPPTQAPTLEVSQPVADTPTPPPPQESQQPPTPTQPAGSDTATPPPSQSTAIPTASNCKDQATFVDDVTIPDGTPVRQGDQFVKTWRVKNSGECTWTSSYLIIFAGGENMNAPLSHPLPDAQPGQTVDISIEMTAPNRGGTYVSNWEFQNPAGQRFGVGFTGAGPLWVEIAISFFNPTEQPPEGGSAVAPPVAGAGQCPVTRNNEFESTILASINQARQENGLPPLRLSDQLSAAALVHSTDMACNNNVSHTGTDGSSWYDRVKAQGYANFTTSRENIYVGNPDFGGAASDAFNWWWNSQVHHDNILFPHVTEIGIAYVYNPKSEYGGYYTTLFARP